MSPESCQNCNHYTQSTRKCRLTGRPIPDDPWCKDYTPKKSEEEDKQPVVCDGCQRLGTVLIPDERASVRFVQIPKKALVNAQGKPIMRARVISVLRCYREVETCLSEGLGQPCLREKGEADGG